MSLRLGRRTAPRALISALAVIAVVLLTPLQAQAAFNASAAGSLSASTAVLAPPTGVGISKTCVILALGGAKINATWTASTSTYATGYTVTILRNGVVDSTNTVTGRTTVSAVYPMDYNTDYTFNIRTVYQNWTSSVVAAPSMINCGLFG